MNANHAVVTSLGDLTRLLADDPAMQGVRLALQQGQSATIDGAWGSSKSLALATLASANPSLLLVVVPHASNVEPLVDDLRSFGAGAPLVLPPLEDWDRRADSTALSTNESAGKRLGVVKAIVGPDPPKILVATMPAILQPVTSLDHLRRYSRRITRGKSIALDDLLEWLTRHGWQRRDAVELPGEFSLRGGILDVFPLDAPDPLRIELFGDEIDSIREFSVESQRSLRVIEAVEITAITEALGGDDSDAPPVHLADIAPAGTWVALVEPLELKAEGKQYLSRLEDSRPLFSVEQSWSRLLKLPSVVLSSLPFASLETTCPMRVESVERFSGEVAKVKAELDKTAGGHQVLIVCHNEAERNRLREVLADSETAREGRLSLTQGRLSAGFRWVPAGVLALSDHELFHRADLQKSEPRRRWQSRAIDSFLDLAEGDYVVHLGHGIGMFRGMRMLDKNDQLEEHLCIEFAEGALVYVPASKINLVQRYVGGGQAQPRLSKVGGAMWERRKKAAQIAVQDLAGDLLDVQAARQAQPGSACPPDSEWQRIFEASFPYNETPDQTIAMAEIRKDMESARPMDRLLCGDVGYGKTELAMRAAFKAVDFGKQVAVLVPTTVLAQQHVRTFRQRMAEFPFTVECLSRFETKADQKRTLKSAAEGGLDILIGTHRLLSGDVKFADLGLVVIDEEQRFGVEHKERLKQLRTQVDILTMTATPIPRTLHGSLLGIRDISNLETPPENRLAVETRVSRFDPTLVRHAILRELNRDGQIYFVHNRVHDMPLVKEQIQRCVPEARITIMHGQMPEEGIESAMVAFLERRADILLATTIIESGLDIPNANTIFINDADHYGLADLHQLRGRVGRSANRAYCYILIDERKTLKPDAQRRLKAIEEYSALGAGFQIALRDLEIRGAGNILGTEQSGHIAAIGYELYCQLLENAVRALKKLPIQTHTDVTVELPWKAYFPHEYLPGERYRIDAYRRLGRAQSPDDLIEFRRELEDRAGPLPEVAANFLDLAEIRLLAQIWQVEAARPDEDGSLLLTYRNRRRIETLEGLRGGELKVVDNKQAYIRIPPKGRNARQYAAVLKRILQPN